MSDSVRVRSFASADEAAVVDLWQRCDLTRPWNDPRKDIQRKLRVQAEMFLVAEDEGAIVGTVMAGYDGHRGWIYSIGVAPGERRRGHARALLAHVEDQLRALGCPKINLQVLAINEEALHFWRAAGYQADHVVSLGRRL